MKDPIATLSHLSLPTPSIEQSLEEIEQGAADLAYIKEHKNDKLVSFADVFGKDG